MITDSELVALVRKYALLNASGHNGKADTGAVIGRIMAERSDLRSESKRVSQVAKNVVAEINTLTLLQQESILQSEFAEAVRSELQRKKDQSKRDSERGYELPELPDAQMGLVITRFPPEPNGYMHIGHAKAAILGSEYAKMYHGRFIMRFDDTNPAAEQKEFYAAFADAFKWLKIEPDVIRNSSDDMECYYALAEKMLSLSKAYICTCPQERMKELRSLGEPCEHRDRPASTNIDLWHKMVSKELGEGEATLRFRGDMKSLNTTMRDPVLFRIIKEPHPLVGEKYAVWPTYDFAGPVEDSLDGVTHAMRSKEYELRDEPYHAILNSLQLRQPRIIEFSRLSLQNTTVHKRTLRKMIQDKLVEGWDDPRLPTISALRRRGFLPDAIREFILAMGLSKVESEPTWDLLESINRKLLDPLAKRYFFVPEPLKLTVVNAPALTVVLRYHPEKAEYGERYVCTESSFFIPSEEGRNLKKGSMLRLIEAYNVEIVDIQDREITAKYAGTETLQEVPKIQWVAEGDQFPLIIKVPGPLLIEEQFNPGSLRIVEGFAENAAREIGEGEIVQFVRFGFCRMDSPGVMIRTHK